MKTVQALVAIGGRASRLRSGGVRVPVSKSFLTLRGRPLLYWTLKSLHLAGVREIVLCADNELQLLEADLVLGQLSCRFTVRDFLDRGLGVHGLPYHAHRLLGDRFFFECGHGISAPEHYRRLDAEKLADNVVFSAFRPHSSNPRQPVALNTLGYVGRFRGVGDYAVAHPMLVDQAYALALPRLGFRIAEVIRHYTSSDRLRYVLSCLPPEFDVVEEMRDALPRYEDFLRRSPNFHV